MNYRTHQSEIQKIGVAIREARLSKMSILAHVVPGGGKSWLPLILLKELPTNVRLAWFVPRLNLKQQAWEDAKKHFGIELHNCDNTLDPCREFRGLVTTHSALTSAPDLWEQEFRRHQYLLCVDEYHHAYSGGALWKALERLRWEHCLLLTGSLERNEGNELWRLQYKQREDGRWYPDPESSFNYYVRYTRELALAEKSLITIDFHHHDGPVKWINSDGEEVEYLKLSEVKRDEQSAALRTALNTGYAEQIFDACMRHWNEHGEKLMVVCYSQDEARKYAKKLKARGVQTFLAISDAEDAQEAITAFRRTSGRCAIATCHMCYEGLDEKIISHICCLTNIRSVPWIYQMLGRAWRASPGKSRCYCFCPDDPQMKAILRRIKAEDDAWLREEMDKRERDDGREENRQCLPLDGQVDGVRVSALDGRPVSPDQQAFMALMRKNGVSPDDPSVAAIFEKLASPHVSPATETTADRLKRIRNDVDKKCKLIDFDKKWPHGTAAKHLMQRNGWKRLPELTEAELKESFIHVENVIARRTS